MARFCSSCGQPLAEGARFCGKCGATQTVAPHSAPPQNYNPPQPNDLEIDFNELRGIFLTLNGRIDRATYFKRTAMVNGVLFWLIGALFWFMAVASTIFTSLADKIDALGLILLILVLVASLIPKYCLDVRRIKDFSNLPATEEKKILAFAALATLASVAVFVGIIDWINGAVHSKFLSTCIIAAIWWGWLQFKPGLVGANSFGRDPLE